MCSTRILCHATWRTKREWDKRDVFSRCLPRRQLRITDCQMSMLSMQRLGSDSNPPPSGSWISDEWTTTICNCKRLFSLLFEVTAQRVCSTLFTGCMQYLFLNISQEKGIRQKKRVFFGQITSTCTAVTMTIPRTSSFRRHRRLRRWRSVSSMDVTARWPSSFQCHSHSLD